MLNVKEISGPGDVVAQQIREFNGRIVSAVVLFDESADALTPSISEEEFRRILSELEPDAAAVPHADYSREAMYTRMPGE